MSQDPAALSPLKLALVAIEDLRARLERADGKGREEIAVIGIGCRLPGGVSGPEALWQLLDAGRDAVGEVPADRWDAAAVYDVDPEAPGKANTRSGGFLESVDGFDPQVFGLSPREAVNMDPQQRLLLEVSWEALEHAGLAPDRMAGTMTGVFTGICSSDYRGLSPHTADPNAINAYSASGTAHSVASGRVAYVLGLQGPAISVDTACSSSLVAIHLACQSLRLGECRFAIAGGVHLMLAPDNTILFCKSKMMSPTGRCKTFSDNADGFVLGEGAAVVVLKRLSDALADADRIIAVIRGSAVNQDGASGGLTVPSGPAQEAVIRAALANAGVAPADVTYVEAHGTGTTLGDPIEVRALAAALGKGRSAGQELLIGSIKTNLGHLEAAAGVTGLLKAILSVAHGAIPAHLHAAQLSTHIPWGELPLAVVGEGQPWPAGRPRLAGVSAFGFSGTNAHVIVGAAPEAAAPLTVAVQRPSHLLALSGRTASALRASAARLGAALETLDADPADVAFTVNTGRAHLAHRRAVWFRDSADLAAKLAAIGGGSEPAGVAAGALTGSDEPRIVFLFTGQGAQHQGMAQSLYKSHPVFRAALDECAELLNPQLDMPLARILWEPDGNIDQTAHTQPALFAVEYALTALWRSFGIVPAAVAGHSLGEYVAACVSGVMSLADALRLVAVRGRLMQRLPGGGAMAAVMAGEESARAAVARHPALSIAAVNGPAHAVLSGPADALAAALAEFAADGVKSKPLVVSHAFHSSLMEPIVAEFERAAAACTFKSPQIPLVSNLTGQPFRGGTLPDAGYWTRHLREPVRFKDSMAWFYEHGYRVFLEVGPAPILSGMARASSGDAEVVFAPSLRPARDDWEMLLGSLGTLYAHGARPDWRAYDAPWPRRPLALPTYPFERRRYWFDAAPQKPQTTVDPSAHPLLGSRLRTAAAEGLLFTRAMTASDPAFLADHRVHDLVVCPATAYLEMALAAGREQDPNAVFAVSGFTIHEALAFPEGGTRVVQTLVAKPANGAAVFRILSAAEGSDDWCLHADGALGRAAGASEHEPLQAVAARCTGSADADTFYAVLEQRGLGLRGRFRGVRSLALGNGEALGSIEAPLPAGELKGYGFHPSALDACVQVLAGAVPGGLDRDSGIYMPLAIDRVLVEGPLPATLWSHARVRPGRTAETLVGDVTVYDASGHVVAAVAQIVLKKAAAVALRRGASRQQGVAELLYEPVWREQERVQEETAAGRMPAPAEVLGDADRRLCELAATHGFDAYARVEPVLDQAVAGYVVRALRACGFVGDGRSGESDDTEALARQLGVAAKNTRAFARLLAQLEEMGLLRRSAGSWQFTGATQPLNPDRTIADLQAAHPGFRAELAFTARFGPKLAEVLRGAVDPLQLLFPEASLADAENLYVRSAGALTYNALVAETVAAAAAAHSGPLSILEIGGGTGGTTQALLPILDPGRVAYTFTDVSPLFAARAAERFASWGALRTRALDLERDPASQGLVDARFDIVIAANVLHATRDLGNTFANVRKLLRPGGLLLMVEVVRPQAWLDLTFGFTEGWWHFTDRERRPDYPLLPRAAWKSFLLDEAGFDSVAMTPSSGGAAGKEPVQALIVARAPAADAAAAEGRHGVLLFADQSGVAAGLLASLEGRGAGAVVSVTPGTSFDFSGNAIRIDPHAAADYARVFREVGVPGTVVHLWSLDAAGAPDSLEALDRAVQHAVGTLLLLVKELLRAGGSRPPRLVVVTRGAQAVSESVDAPALAAVWGFLKALRLEHPELQPRVVDLAPSGQGGEADELCHEVLAADGEDEVALRPGGRRVLRLPPPGSNDEARKAPWELAISARGVLDNLELRPAERRAPGLGEVEIEVRAAALNFRDVLSALDLYPGTPPPFGSEAAGRVLAVGSGVAGLRPGDDVIAVAPGALRSHLTASASLVVAKPAHLSYEAAAGVAVPFVTAAFCLEHVARLRAGESVLIHAAAGGVGLAAVQVARRAGARILATAGSERKRAYLRSLGIADVMDSRSFGFADEIHRATRGRGVDVVLNSLRAEFVDASFAALAQGGRFVEIGKRDIWSAEQARTRRPDAAYEVVDWGATALVDPALVRRILEQVMAEFAAGRLQPLPRMVFAPAQLQAAFRAMSQARHIGKIVVALPQQPNWPGVRADAAYLVTGGFGGLGLRTAQWLVERGATEVALAGRRPPSAEAVAAIGRLQAQGARVSAHVADVADAAAMREVFAAVAATGKPLRGIVHSAGTLDDSLVPNLDWRHFETVLRPKVDGAFLLHQLSRGAPLDCFVLYSSIASLLGSPGQANHAAANACLDALAHHRHGLGLPALSINWGVWDTIGAAARRGSGTRAAARGLSAFSPTDGIAALEGLLAGGAVQAGVMRVDWPAWLDSPAGAAPFYAEIPRRAAPAEAAVAAGPASFAERLAAVPEAYRQQLVREAVTAGALRVLGLDAAQGIDARRPLQEMGLDSLMAVELRNALAAAVGQPLPATLLFDYPSVDVLVAYISAEVLKLGAPPGAAKSAAPVPARATVDAIEDLSDDEVEALLASKRAGRAS